jgi:hypothetical protein
MAVVEATINLDMLNMGEQVELSADMLKDQPVKGLIEQGYLKVVKGDDVQDDVDTLPDQEVATVEATQETPQARRARTGKNTE